MVIGFINFDILQHINISIITLVFVIVAIIVAMKIKIKIKIIIVIAIVIVISKLVKNCLQYRFVYLIVCARIFVNIHRLPLN